MPIVISSHTVRDELARMNVLYCLSSDVESLSNSKNWIKPENAFLCQKSCILFNALAKLQIINQFTNSQSIFWQKSGLFLFVLLENHYLCMSNPTFHLIRCFIMTTQYNNDIRTNNIFFLCSLVEYVTRQTHNHPGDIVTAGAGHAL